MGNKVLISHSMDGQQYEEDAETLYKEFIDDETLEAGSWNSLTVEEWNDVLFGSDYTVLQVMNM